MATKSKAQIELEDFKKQVRDRIVEAVAQEEICREGANDALKEFGLDPITNTFNGEFYVKIIFSGLEVVPGSGNSFSNNVNDRDDLVAAIESATDSATTAFIMELKKITKGQFKWEDWDLEDYENEGVN